MRAVYWYVYAYQKRLSWNWWTTILTLDTSTWLEVGIEEKNSEEDKRNLDCKSKGRSMILPRNQKHTFQNFKKVTKAVVRMGQKELIRKLVKLRKKSRNLMVLIIPRSSSLTWTWKRSSIMISIVMSLNFWVMMRFKKTHHTFLKKTTLW